MSALPDLNALSLKELYGALSATGLVERLLRLAHDEDLVGDGVQGDVTTMCWGDPDREISARVVVREPATVAGLAAIGDLCAVFAPNVRAAHVLEDGRACGAGDAIATLTGPASKVLALERPLLNLLSRLSGIASLTRKYADLASPVRVLDTRKTTPGLRVLEKYAVRCGGGFTHRMGLHDAVLLKDNHLAGIPIEELGERVRRAATRARELRPIRFFQVEVDSLEQLEHVIPLGEEVIDIVLLDNMTPDELRSAVEMRDSVAPGVELEASGGVSLETIGAIAATGIDRISVGALTHSATSVDIGLDRS